MRKPPFHHKGGSTLDRGSETQLQHLAELGRLSASLLHEISNPLAAALLHLSQPQSSDAAAIRQAKRDLQVMQSYLEAMRQQVRLSSSAVSFNLAPQVNQVRRIVIPQARSNGIRLTIAPAPDCRIYGDPVKLQQLLANLIINAVEAYETDIFPTLRRDVSVTFKLARSYLMIRVQDWGQGISSTDMARVFEPFFTTKHISGHGLGLGLSIVKRYVSEDFHGTISVRSSKRGGTEFTVKLPVLGQ